MAGLDLKDLARRGAAARLAELHAEQAAILREFPELKRAAGPSYTDDGTTILTNKRRGRRRMSAAQKAEVSRRMKKYWANRRKARRAGA
jgi:hypothetical protein